MSKIYTKKGDAGETGTFVGRFSKGEQIATALGTIDELNSWIGLCRTKSTTLDKQLKQIQFNLMTIGTILAGAKVHRFKGSETAKLERLIDRLDKQLPEIHNFIYPIGYFQVCRTIVRRCEREIVRAQITDKNILKYINRLSDAMFMMARYMNLQQGLMEEVWKG